VPEIHIHHGQRASTKQAKVDTAPPAPATNISAETTTGDYFKIRAISTIKIQSTKQMPTKMSPEKSWTSTIRDFCGEVGISSIQNYDLQETQ
jgi:hypothetical protein